MGGCMSCAPARAKELTDHVEPKSLERVYLVCGGTRGDQQPLVMIGVQLQKLGYAVCLCIGPEGKAWVDTYGFESIELASFKKTMSSSAGVMKAGETGDFQILLSSVAPELAQTLPGEVTALYTRMKADPDAVGVVVSSTHFQLSEVLARKLNIHGTSLFFSPFCPTKDFAPYMIDTRNSATWKALPGFEDNEEYPGEAVNRDLWNALLNQWGTNWLPLLQLSGSLCEAEAVLPQDDAGMLELLSNQIGCAPPDLAKPMTSRQTETLFPYSDQLVGAGGPADFTSEQRAAQVGFIFDRSDGNSLSPFSNDVQVFLGKGSAPVYFGWGSMMREKNDELVRAAVSACKLGAMRGIILAGWAHLSLDMLDAKKDSELLEYAKDNILVAEYCDHVKLFPQCSCLVTHGGMGTMAAMLRSGKPCIVTPVWWDQNFGGDRIEALGVGKRGPHFAQVSGENLASLIKEVTTVPKYAEKAKTVAAAINAEAPGDAVAAKRIHEGIQKKKMQNA